MHRHAGLLALEFTEITARVRPVAHPGKEAGLNEIVQQSLTVNGLERPQTSSLPDGQSEARHLEELALDALHRLTPRKRIRATASPRLKR